MFRIPSILPLFFPQLTWRVNSDQKELFLTFDDGPVPGPTEFVLDTLKKYNAKATFFCIGDNVQKHSAIFKRTIQEGHAIGNHTFNHIKGWGTSTEKYVANVELCTKEISNQYSVFGNQLPVTDHRLPNTVYQPPLTSHPLPTTSHQPPLANFFRPPYGRIRTKQIDALKDKYRIIMWDVLTSDYSKSLSPEKCLAGSIKATRPGSIIVFHDSLKAERNMTYALPRYLDYFSQQGYSFRVLPT
jgi:peptidoglycan-N-acetylglucosamine deacetylase